METNFIQIAVIQICMFGVMFWMVKQVSRGDNSNGFWGLLGFLGLFLISIKSAHNTQGGG